MLISKHKGTVFKYEEKRNAQLSGLSTSLIWGAHPRTIANEWLAWQLSKQRQRPKQELNIFTPPSDIVNRSAT